MGRKAYSLARLWAFSFVKLQVTCQVRLGKPSGLG